MNDIRTLFTVFLFIFFCYLYIRCLCIRAKEWQLLFIFRMGQVFESIYRYSY